MEVKLKLVIAATNKKERLNPYIVCPIPDRTLNGGIKSFDIACGMLEKITGIKAYKDGQGWTFVDFSGIVEITKDKTMYIVYTTILPEKVELMVEGCSWTPLNDIGDIYPDEIPILAKVI